MTASNATQLEIGAVIGGRYRLEELLGAGGFGAVYRTVQLDTNRQVALKLLHGHLIDSPTAVPRFLREIRLAEKLEHPNTVSLYDLGQDERGLPFMVLQLLKGRSIREALEQDGAMSANRVGRIALQVLKSLMEAHELGIVHRDIKPDNIFLTDVQGAPDFVKVRDFGIAKCLIASGTVNETMQTEHGIVLGTPAYMAPEQVRGELVGPASDLYSLGLVMSEMLTGDVVVDGTGAIDQCIVQISDEPVPLPATVVESPLGPVITLATAKTSNDRYRFASVKLTVWKRLDQATETKDAIGLIEDHGGSFAVDEEHLEFFYFECIDITGLIAYVHNFQGVHPM